MPIMTLLKPFRVARIEDFDNKEDPKYPFKAGMAEITSYFNLDQNLLNEIKSSYNRLNKKDDASVVPLLTIQVRCVQLNNKEHFIMNFPTFGLLFVNGQNHQYFKI